MTFLPAPSDYGSLQDRWCLIHPGFQGFSTGPLINTFSHQWRSKLENRERGKKLGSIMELLGQKKVMKCIRTVCPLSELEIHRILGEDERPPPPCSPPSERTVIHRQTLEAKHTRGQSHSGYCLQVSKALWTETSARPRGGISSRPADYTVTKQKSNDQKKKKNFF